MQTAAEGEKKKRLFFILFVATATAQQQQRAAVKCNDSVVRRVGTSERDRSKYQRCPEENTSAISKRKGLETE